MKLPHLNCLPALGSMILTGLYACNLAAQPAFPAKPVRFVVGSTAGGGPDITARIIAAKLSEALGQQVVVENRAGASTMIGAEFVAKSAADGYTLLMAGGAHVASAAMHAKIAYHPINDFAPVTQAVSLPFVLIVHPSLPAKSVPELIALARSKPGEIQFGSSGTGTPPHLSMELLLSMSGTRMLHVPYKGNSQAMIDVLAGHVQTMMQSAPAALPHIKAGRLRALGVTSRKVSASLPDVPPIADAGVPGYESVQWYGVLRTRRHAARNRHAVAGRNRKSPAATRRQGKAARRWRRTGRQHARNFHRVPPRRIRQMGQTRQDHRHQARLATNAHSGECRSQR